MRAVPLLLLCLAAGRAADDLAAARAAMDRGDLAAAERALAAELQARPDDAEALRLSGRLGLALANARQFERAEIQLTRALALEPANFKALYNLGVIANYAGHPERAREILETALRQQPQDVDALYSLAYVDQALKQWEHAVGLLAQAARLAPQRADIQKLLAIAATELHAYDDAVAAWDRYLKLEPNDDLARRERGSAAARIGQFEKAIPDLEWFLARHPGDAAAHFELGIAEAERDPAKSLALLDKAIGLQPDFAAARSARGNLYYQQGKPETALADLEIAARLAPEDAVILDRLGQTYAALDRPADAVRWLRKASGLAPGDSKIQMHFARALADAGEAAEAKAAMDRFKQLGPPKSDRVPAGLVEYLNMTPEQRLADYRARVEKAVRENPGDAEARARYLKLMDSVPESARDGEYYLGRAQILYAMDQPADAAAALDQALKTGSREARLMKAVALEVDGKSGEAGRLLSEIQNRWPGWYPVWVARGVIWKAQNRAEESRQALETAAALGARNDSSRELRTLLTKAAKDW